MKKEIKKNLLGGLLLAVASVSAVWVRNYYKTIPKGIIPLKPFDVKKYVGKWYEVARMNYRFENNLKNVTADYSLNEDWSVKVVNRGYNTKKNKYEEVSGKAIFAKSNDEGALKVSFFGPFYTGYNVIALDKDYKYALVVGRNRDYLWLLSRSRIMPDNIKQKYLQVAKGLKFDISKLTWTEHTENVESGVFESIIEITCNV